MAVFFLLVGVSGLIFPLDFQYWESIMLPLAVSCLILVLSVINLVKEIIGFTRQAKKETTIGKSENGIYLRRFGVASGCIAGLMLGIYLVGFYIAVPLFALTYLKLRGQSWLGSVVFAIVMLGIVYGIFNFTLNATQFKGLIFGGH